MLRYQSNPHGTEVMLLAKLIVIGGLRQVWKFKTRRYIWAYNKTDITLVITADLTIN